MLGISRLFFTGLFCALSLAAQGQVDSASNTADSLKPARIWSVAPIIFYSPETRLAFGAGGLYFFRPHKRIKAGRSVSNEAAVVVYSLRGQFRVQLVGDFYADGDRWRASHNTGYELFPDRFYGVGNNTKEENEEQFTRRSGQGEFSFFRASNDKFLAGLSSYFGQHRFTNIQDSGFLDLGLVPGVEGGFDWGIGPQVLFDTRDNIYFPSKGTYLFASAVVHLSALGSAQQYTDVTLDFRGFFNPVGSHIVGLQAFGRFIPGNPPFHRMALLGGPDQLRGFFEGRYRDRYYIMTQAEYRFPIWKFIRGTTFFAVGDVARNYQAFKIGDIKYAGGAGLRLIVSEKDGISLRFDYGVGKNLEHGFYFQFNEAF